MSSAKEIALRYATQIWDEKEVSVIDQLVDENVLIHSLLGDFYGKNALRDVVQTWLKGFPDLRVDNHLIIAENDLVAIQWSAQGTHQGEFKERHPTNKRVSYSGATIYRVQNGKIVEYWAYLDMNHLFHQIGD